MKKIITLISIFLLLLQFFIIQFYYNDLPTEIIIHKDLLGRPSNFGDKSLLLRIFSVSCVFFIFFYTVMHYLSKWKHLNGKYVLSVNLYDHIINLIKYLCLLTTLVFSVIIIDSILFQGLFDFEFNILIFSLTSLFIPLTIYFTVKIIKSSRK